MARKFLYLLCVFVAISLACVMPAETAELQDVVLAQNALPTATIYATQERSPTPVTPTETPVPSPSPTPRVVLVEPTLSVQTRLLEKGHALLTPPDDPWKAVSWNARTTERVVIPTPNVGSADLPAFVNTVPKVEKSTLAGVSAPGVFEYQVMQQPAGNNEFVSDQANIVTQYGHPLNYGVVGLLAHDMPGMAGLSFYLLQPGQEIVLVYGDGSTVTYVVTRIVKFRALSPNSAHSDFEYLEDTETDPNHSIGSIYNYGEVYNWMYTGEHHVTFQTCLEGTNSDGYQDLSWGRVFVLAYPK
jgi:hypothetical protein